jgi:heat-inducible transcriptional repressor
VRLKHIELISTRGRQVLMVMVMTGGEIHQRIVMLDEPVSQEQLSQTADRLTNIFQSKDAETIRTLSNQLQGLDNDITGWLITEMTETESLASGDVYLDGLTNVLAEPEFSGSDDARRALRLLEERSLLQDLLARTILTSNVGGIQVLIGGEGTWDELRQCSIVLARYGAPGLAMGTLGVLGPMRMSYGRTISTVRFLANLLSDMVTETLVEDEY